jgi:hypothetical protein
MTNKTTRELTLHEVKLIERHREFEREQQEIHQLWDASFDELYEYTGENGDWDDAAQRFVNHANTLEFDLGEVVHALLKQLGHKRHKTRTSV